MWPNLNDLDFALFPFAWQPAACFPALCSGCIYLLGVLIGSCGGRFFFIGYMVVMS